MLANMMPITGRKRQKFEESSQTTLLTSSFGLNGLKTLKSRLIGRLARLTTDNADDERPCKIQNDAEFLEFDLRYIFETLPTVISLSEENCHILDEKAQNLLALLSDAVNESIIEPPEVPFGPPKATYHQHPYHLSYDVEMLNRVYPRLGALVRFLDATSEKINLASGSGFPLFTVPHGEAGSRMMSGVTEWKAFLRTLPIDTYSLTTKARNNQPDMPPKCASAVVNAIFKKFQQLKCEAAHEIRLRLSQDLFISSGQPFLDMFISCCPSSDALQEVRCGPFQ